MSPATLQRHGFKAKAFIWLARAAERMARWPNRLTPPPFRLMQIGSAYWQSRVLHTAAELDLATQLADATLPADELARRVGAHPDALARLLRMLAAMGVFQEVAGGGYRNNALSSPLRSDHPQTVRAMVLMHNAPEMSRPWFEQLTAGVRSGQPPFALTHGQGLYEWMDGHPEFDALFGQAMGEVEALVGDSFATEFHWPAFTRVIDVGGSQGAKSLAILKRHAHLQALVVDRPQAIAGAAEHWAGHAEAAACLPRMRFEAGDLLQAVPAATGPGDVYLLSAVLHGFDDDTAARALRTVAQAARPAGATIVLMEMLRPEQGCDLSGASFDMQMFMGTRGRERTLSEWLRLFERSGVRLREVVHLASLGKMLVLEATGA